MIYRDERIALLRQYMDEKGYDYFIIYTADMHLSEYISDCDKYREYFSGFTGSAGTLLISKTDLYIWVDGRYYIQAEKELLGLDINIFHIGEKGTPSIIKIIKDTNKDNITIGIDGHYLSYSEYENLQNVLNEDKNIVIDCDAVIPDYVWPDRPYRRFGEIRNISENDSGISSIDKINCIRDLIKSVYKKNDYCFVTSNLTAIMWIANIRGCDIEYVPVAYSYLMIYPDKTELFVNKSQLSNSIEEELNNNGIQCFEYNYFYRNIKNVNGYTFLADVNANNAIIINALQKNNFTIVDESYLVRKDIKSGSEIKNIRKHHIEDAVAVIKFIVKLKHMAKDNNLPNEYEAAQLLDNLRLSNHNCMGLSFETISAYGKNGAIVHYSAQKDNCAKLEPKGFYLVDSGAHYNCCTTDITRTISLGELTEKEKLFYTAVLKGNIALSEARFLEGCRGENIDILARGPLWDLGVDYRHGTGHGIGCELSVHEGPLSIRYKINSKFNQPVMEEGMIVSDEPGVYFEDEFGVRIENELLIDIKEENEWGKFLGFEVLTLVPYDRNSILIECLTEQEKAIINNYHQKIFEIMQDYLDGIEIEWLRKETLPL